MANSWQGEFPWQNLKADGFEGTSPVGSFSSQRLRAVRHDREHWEWTSDDFSSTHAERKACCAPRLLLVSASRER
jgi:formylglycine-generating enzyme